jgi:hypothetical protein
MSNYFLRLEGTEEQIKAFREELQTDLRSAGVGENTVEISPARPVRRKLTEPLEQGHIEWVEVAVKFAVGVLTPVIADKIKDLIKKRANRRGLRVKHRK